MSRAVWIPIVVALNLFAGWISVRSNITTDRKWFFFAWAVQIVPLWAVIARTSNDLVFDGLMYDATLTTAFTLGTLWFLGEPLSLLSWAGLCFVFGGLAMFKAAL